MGDSRPDVPASGRDNATFRQNEGNCDGYHDRMAEFASVIGGKRLPYDNSMRTTECPPRR
jgi:hypothetical protein